MAIESVFACSQVCCLLLRVEEEQPFFPFVQGETETKLDVRLWKIPGFPPRTRLPSKYYKYDPSAWTQVITGRSTSFKADHSNRSSLPTYRLLTYGIYRRKRGGTAVFESFLIMVLIVHVQEHFVDTRCFAEISTDKSFFGYVRDLEQGSGS